MINYVCCWSVLSCSLRKEKFLFRCQYYFLKKIICFNHTEAFSPKTLKYWVIVCIEVSAPSPLLHLKKHHPTLSCHAFPLNQQTVQAPPFRQSLPSILFFVNPLPPILPLKVGLFSEPQKY